MPLRPQILQTPFTTSVARSAQVLSHNNPLNNIIRSTQLLNPINLPKSQSASFYTASLDKEAKSPAISHQSMTSLTKNSYSNKTESQSIINSNTIRILLPKARTPETVAQIETLKNNRDIYPLFTRHLLIKASGSENFFLPTELEFIRPIVEKAFEYEKKIQSGFNSERCFLTVRRSVISYDKNNSQMQVQENVRNLWHYDGAHPPENLRIDSIYSYSDWHTEGFPENFKTGTALSTQFYIGSLPKLPETANLKEDMTLYIHLAPKDNNLIISPKKGELVHWSGLHPHRSPLLASDQIFKDAGVEKGQIVRTFVRVTFVEDKKFIDVNNCHVNMDMFPKAYSPVISPDSLSFLGDRKSLNTELIKCLKNFDPSKNSFISVQKEGNRMSLEIALSDTLKMQSKFLSKSEAMQIIRKSDPIGELQWSLVSSIKNEFSTAPIKYLKNQFDINLFRKAWEMAMIYDTVREEILSMNRRNELFAPSISLDSIKSSFDYDIAHAHSGTERTRLFMEKNEFIAMMHPSPLKETVNLWRLNKNDVKRREKMKALIDEAIDDPINPFAKISAIRSKIIVNSGKDLLDKSIYTNDFVDLLGDRKTLTRYLNAVLSHKDSFKDLVKANQERLTHSVYGHMQLRVTDDLQTVLGIWVPLNLNKSTSVIGDDIVPFNEFNNDTLNASKEFIAIEPPHNHHFDFSSKVVMGKFFQTTYDVVPYDKEVKSSKYIYDQNGKHWHIGMHKVGWAWPEHDDAGIVKNLRSNGTVSMNEGDVYYCYNSVIHAPVLNTQGKTAISLHSHAHEHGVTPYFYLPESMYKFHTEQQDTISKGKTQIEPNAIRGLFRGIQNILENHDSEKSSAQNWLKIYNNFMEAPDFNLLQK